MKDMAVKSDIASGNWLSEPVKLIVKGLTGIVAVIVALKAISHDPSSNPDLAADVHVFRLLAFAALTVWTALTIGIQRRGKAAVIVLVFAIIVDFVILPARGSNLYTIASANLGIVLAYCGLQLYWMRANQSRPRAEDS
ncbi:MAG: hypothetical protein AAGH90_02960 [Pseudomonadota bacterium]